MSSLRIKAHEIIESISEKKIAEVVDFLEYLKIKEEVEATNEILSDKKLLDSIQKGLAQMSNGELSELDDETISSKTGLPIEQVRKLRSM